MGCIYLSLSLIPVSGTPVLGCHVCFTLANNAPRKIQITDYVKCMPLKWCNVSQVIMIVTHRNPCHCHGICHFTPFLKGYSTSTGTITRVWFIGITWMQSRLTIDHKCVYVLWIILYMYAGKCIYHYQTHWGRDKSPTICRRHLPTYFLCFDSNFILVCSQGPLLLT